MPKIKIRKKVNSKLIDSILDKNDYSWIGVENYSPDVSQDNIDFLKEYDSLKKHHEKETVMLIEKCRLLAKYIKKNNIIV